MRSGWRLPNGGIEFNQSEAQELGMILQKTARIPLYKEGCPRPPAQQSPSKKEEYQLKSPWESCTPGVKRVAGGRTTKPQRKSRDTRSVDIMYVPVNIQFYQEWLRLTAELTVAIDDAVEQRVRLQGAMNEMQRALDDHGTLDELQAARDRLEWAARWRDEAVAGACYIEKKINVVKAMDQLVEACKQF